MKITLDVDSLETFGTGEPAKLGYACVGERMT